MVSKEQLLRYLQSQLTDFMQDKEKYGSDERIVIQKMDAMIACKEMVETILMEPVNLGKDGKETIGF